MLLTKPFPGSALACYMNEEILREISIKKINVDSCVPYDLLLDADPSMQAIEKYLPFSEIYIAEFRERTIAVIALFALDNDALEIKNIAVEPSLQRNGIGRFMLEKAIQIATDKEFKTILIGTSNSSIGQLYLYQKCGFEISGIRHNFFIENYTERIFENGIQCKHMIVLTKSI